MIALVWAAWNFWIITFTKIADVVSGDSESASLNTHSSSRQLRLLKEVHNAISTGAEAFLRAGKTFHLPSSRLIDTDKHHTSCCNLFT